MGEHSIEARVTGVRFPPPSFIMVGKKLFTKNLTFKTIPEGDTLDVSALLPVNTKWRILPRKNGMYLVEYDRKKEHPVSHKISDYCHSPQERTYVEIKAKLNSFIVPSINSPGLMYSMNNEIYIPLGGALIVTFPERVRFRYIGGLEFTIEI